MYLLLKFEIYHLPIRYEKRTPLGITPPYLSVRASGFLIRQWSIYIENSIPLIEKDNGKSIDYCVAGRRISACGQFIDRSREFSLELYFSF